MEKKAIALTIALLASIILVASILPVAKASLDPAVTVTVIGANGSPLANAKVTLYDTAGVSYQGTTNANGVAVISVPANGTYLVVVESTYYVLSTINVLGDTSATVNASAMYYVNISSDPISVQPVIYLSSFSYAGVTVSTNTTVYASGAINISFPKEVSKFPNTYKLSKIVYDALETTNNTISLDMTKNYAVTAYYTKSFFVPMEPWMVGLLVAVIAAAIIVAWRAGAKTARAIIQEWEEENRRFVKRKED